MTNIYNIIRRERDKRRNELLCKDSYAEKHFAKMLNTAGIFYVKEKCYFNNKGKWCYIDFFLPMYRIAIEIDGKEHSYGKRKEKDIQKTLFLKEDRKIYTIRYTNAESLRMDKISLIDIITKANLKRDLKYLEFKKKEKFSEIANIKKKFNIDETKSYWLYDKDKDCTFYFKDIYIMKHTTGTGYKYLLNAINKDFNTSRLYIINEDIQELKKEIDKYYNYLWEQ